MASNSPSSCTETQQKYDDSKPTESEPKDCQNTWDDAVLKGFANGLESEQNHPSKDDYPNCPDDEMEQKRHYLLTAIP
jgi:hypothetical protein